MPTPNDSPGRRILRMWQRLSPKPGGTWLFNRMVARMVPYTGALGADLFELTPGHARVRLRDRRGVRNHLRSVHALALANMAEFASGTAMLTALPDGVRGIVTRLEIDYVKKARGTIVAAADLTLPPITGATELFPEAVMTDASGDVVARARVTWKISMSSTD